MVDDTQQDKQPEGGQQAESLADLEVTACVEVHAHDDYQVIFAHNRGTFRPWAYPMPREVAEYIAGAVVGRSGLMAENASLRAQLEKADGLIASLQEENQDLASQLKAATSEVTP